MKKILVTGAFGFIGSHLVELLISKGHSVIAFDRYNVNNDYGWLNDSKYKKDIEFFLGDIRDYDSVYKAVKQSSFIFHLAALIGIPYSYLSPLAYLKTNVEGTYNILESAKNLNIKNTLITSTSEVYGSAVEIPIDENHRLLGQSPYSASKIAADQLALSYANSFKMPIKIVRPFNTFGPRQSTRAIIPTIIAQLLKHPNYINLGNTETKRDYTYVDDTCNAFISILKSKKLEGEITNIATSTNYSILEIINIISKIMKVKPKLIIEKKRVRPKNSEVTELLGSNLKLKNNTNWDYKISFEEGLKKTIKWIKINKNKYKFTDYHV